MQLPWVARITLLLCWRIPWAGVSQKSELAGVALSILLGVD